MDKTVNDLLLDKAHSMFLSPLGEEIYKAALMAVDNYDMQRVINRGVLLGFSGGADSVMLLLFLLEYKARKSLNFNIKLCHVNHMIRGDEAERDADFSREFAAEAGVHLSVVSRDIPEIAKQNGQGIEEAARTERYKAFSDIVKDDEMLSAVAVAHNASDNAETVVFNILRGSGLKGACGISPVRDNIIRPLIYVSKNSIREALDEYKIKYVNDSTNDELDYTRNYIRHIVIPSLERINSNPVEAFTRFSENVRLDDAYLNELSDAQYCKMIAEDYIDKYELLSLPMPIFSRVFARLLKHNGGKMCERGQIVKAYELLSCDNFSLSLPGGIRFICERGKCFFDTCESRDYSECVIMLENGINRLCGFNADVIISANEDFDKSFLNVYNFSIQTVIPSDIIKGGLFLRFKKDGDAYRYGGITHKLKKVFNDRNIPPHQRSRIPIICDDEGILWVPGLKARDYTGGGGASCNFVKIWLGVRKCSEGEDRIFTALPRNTERLG